MMIRVARVWAHRSPSGPSFRRQSPGAAAEATAPARAGGPLRSEGPPAGGDDPSAHQLEERQPTRLR